VTRIHMTETFYNAKFNLFNQLTGKQWKIKFFGSAPYFHTIREFTEAEKQQDKLNDGLKGVRTFWFGGHHWRGLPEMLTSESNEENTTDYIDWAWVPKRQLNEYFTREYYDTFSQVCATR